MGYVKFDFKKFKLYNGLKRCTAMDIKENSIVIVDDAYKEEFLKIFRKDRKLFAISVLGLKEFEKKFYFDYSKEAVFYVHKKCGVLGDIAKIYLDNLYYANASSSDEKVRFLYELKRDLDEQGLLIRDSRFRHHIEGRNIYLYNLKLEDKYFERMFENLSKIANVIVIDDNHSARTKKRLYKLSNPDEEVAFIASSIADLLKKGTPIDKIVLANVSEEYTPILKKTFKEFKIPLELPNSSSIYGTFLVSKFKELFEDDMTEVLEKLKEYVKSENDEYIYKKILGVLNDYHCCKSYTEVGDFIFEDLKKISNKTATLKHAVRVIDFIREPIENDRIVFLMNFNQGSIPIAKKDEDYLSDATKRSLGLSDSVDINKRVLSTIREKIATTRNLIVTYSARNLAGELYISNAYEEDLFESAQALIEYSHSDSYNKRILLCKRDENKKYGSTDGTLKMLEGHYKDVPYCSYDNSFKGIKKENLKNYLNGSLVLSYSSMDHFFKCSFRYYLEYILKIDKFEDTFASVIGSLFHEILAKCFVDNFDFDGAWDSALKATEYPLGPMENFYLNLLKEELKTIISYLKDQTQCTNLKKALYEEKITVPLDKEGKVIFKGFVDKILYTDDEDEQVVAIIDYKTGNPILNLDDLIYGIDMQLPIYAYLIKHSKKFADAQLGGFYLQKILNSKKTEEEKRGALKLQGYSNANTRILRQVDATYEDSSLIKSMKLSKGKFSAHAKILTDEQIDKMISIVEEKIKEAVEHILNADYYINPKEIGGKNRGCEFCRFKDICYVKNENIKKLNKVKKEDFLGGEEDGLD